MGGEDNWDMKVRFLSTGVIAGTMTLGIYVMQAWKERQIRFWQNRNDYLSDQFQLLNHWLEIKSEGKSAAKYFLDRDYHHIAVYGMAELANRLLEDLEGSSVSVDYGIDRDACCSISRMLSKRTKRSTLATSKNLFLNHRWKISATFRGRML